MLLGGTGSALVETKIKNDSTFLWRFSKIYAEVNSKNKYLVHPVSEYRHESANYIDDQYTKLLI